MTNRGQSRWRFASDFREQLHLETEKYIPSEIERLHDSWVIVKFSDQMNVAKGKLNSYIKCLLHIERKTCENLEKLVLEFGYFMSFSKCLSKQWNDNQMSDVIKSDSKRCF